MKKGPSAAVLSLIMLLFYAGLTGAISSDIKQSYLSGESAIVKFSGIINEQIEKSQVEFKKDDRERIPFVFDIKKIGDFYYLWFITPLNHSGNYTLLVNDISTTVLGSHQKTDYKINFTISKDYSDYFIDPGFAITRDQAEFTLTNLKDNPIDINVGLPVDHVVRINPGTNLIKISSETITATQLKEVKIGKYIIPVYIMKNQSLPPAKRNFSVEIRPHIIELNKLVAEKDIAFNITVINEGANKIEDLFMTANKDYFEFSPSKKISLLPNEQASFKVELSNSIKYNVTENIIIKSEKGNFSYNIPINIRFYNNRSQIYPVNKSDGNDSQLCVVDLEGVLCPANNCKGASTKALDGNCCIGKCELGSSSSGGWVGYFIIGIAILVIVFIVVKYRKVKPGKSDVEKAIEGYSAEDKKMKLP